jgi:hypothetical protein
VGRRIQFSKRLREINGTASYADHGPWELSDFLHVTDWQLVEKGLHRHFQKNQVRDAIGTRELLELPPHAAREQLRLTDVSLRVDLEKTDQVFQNRDLSLFLYRLFQLSGLFGSLDIQGAWTLSLLPSTAGGRWFTLNIGPHEVAFSTRRTIENKLSHYLVLDRLILDYPETIIWLGKRDGDVRDTEYTSARERAVLVSFSEDFANAEKVFKLPGIRRSLTAYWSEALADLRQRGAKSVFARYHSYDAVAELLQYKRATESVFQAAMKGHSRSSKTAEGTNPRGPSRR